MREDEITIEGVTLTTEKAREVLAWVDEPWRLTPERMFWMRGEPHLREYGGSDLARLTPAIVDQLRDHVTPWVGVRRDEVKPGEVFLMEGLEQMATDAIRASHDRTYMRSVVTGHGDPEVPAGSELEYFSTDLVEVRRPRRPALTLGQVEPGQRFTWADGERIGDGFRRTLNGYLCEQTWEHFPLEPQASAPVRIVEGES